MHRKLFSGQVTITGDCCVNAGKEQKFQLHWTSERVLRLWDPIRMLTIMLGFGGTDALVVTFSTGPCPDRAAGDPVQVQRTHWQGCLQPVFLALHPMDKMLSAVCWG